MPVVYKTPRTVRIVQPSKCSCAAAERSSIDKNASFSINPLSARHLSLSLSFSWRAKFKVRRLLVYGASRCATSILRERADKGTLSSLDFYCGSQFRTVERRESSELLSRCCRCASFFFVKVSFVYIFSRDARWIFIFSRLRSKIYVVDRGILLDFFRRMCI